MQESLAGLRPLRLTQPVDYSAFTAVKIYILHPNFYVSNLICICGVEPPSVNISNQRKLEQLVYIYLPNIEVHIVAQET
jgi:hypothetical protein